MHGESYMEALDQYARSVVHLLTYGQNEIYPSEGRLKKFPEIMRKY